LVDFYDHKPKLNEFEKRVYKRLTRKDQSIQTDKEPETVTRWDKNRKIPIIRLPPPLAMERVEEFLTENHLRLLDLYRRLDRNKSWGVVKEDFMRLAEEVKIFFYMKKKTKFFQNESLGKLEYQ
jgi:ribosomal protein S10